MATDRYLTPPEYAKRIRVDVNKVLGWIRAGKLAAINVSNGTRPRYAISPASIESFERGIATEAPAPPVRRRRATPVKDYFPDGVPPWSTLKTNG